MPTEIFEKTIADHELRPTHLTIDLGALRHNLRVLRAHVAPAAVMPILKANAYGHGLVEVGRLCEAEGIPVVGVAYLEEGLRLRQAGVRIPVLVLGGIVGDQIPRFIENDLVLTASSIDKLRAIDGCAEALGKRAKVHLKIDTGMERIGVHWYSAHKLLEASLSVKHTDVDGVFTHFANADVPESNEVQLARFEEALDFYRQRSLRPPPRHAASSGAIAVSPRSHLEMVRPGALFYGVSASLDPAMALDLGLRPALSWSSQVVFFKVVRPGDPVSYGSTWAPAEPTRLITLPVGYGDGYTRAMSGRAEVLVSGRRFPVVGRICMDQLMVSIGWGTAYNGDPVVLIGRSGDEIIRVEDVAAWAGTIPHEVLATINTRVPRVYVDTDAAAGPRPGA